jgi:hypothetical protein
MDLGDRRLQDVRPARVPLEEADIILQLVRDLLLATVSPPADYLNAPAEISSVASHLSELQANAQPITRTTHTIALVRAARFCAAPQPPGGEEPESTYQRNDDAQDQPRNATHIDRGQYDKADHADQPGGPAQSHDPTQQYARTSPLAVVRIALTPRRSRDPSVLPAVTKAAKGERTRLVIVACAALLNLALGRRGAGSARATRPSRGTSGAVLDRASRWPGIALVVDLRCCAVGATENERLRGGR